MRTFSTALPIEGASNMEDTTTAKNRNVTYSNLVVRDDLASGNPLQHNPQAAGPKQQHNSSRQHITSVWQKNVWQDSDVMHKQMHVRFATPTVYN